MRGRADKPLLTGPEQAASRYKTEEITPIQTLPSGGIERGCSKWNGPDLYPPEGGVNLLKTLSYIKLTGAGPRASGVGWPNPP